MNVRYLLLFVFVFTCFQISVAQQSVTDSVLIQIIQEVEENSHLEELAHHLLDIIGPRLVGTPQQQHAHEWAIETFAEWGIEARNEQFGEWRGWERGISHIDMVHPRVVTLEGMQLAWSPSTPPEGVTAGLVIIPEVSNRKDFEDWLPNAEGKFVMLSMHQPTGRPNYNWEEYGTEESQERMRKKKAETTLNWRNRIQNTGLNNRSYIEALEAAGAVGIVTSNWSEAFGTNRIFGAHTENIPTVDILLEDYGMLYRMVKSGTDPQIRVQTESRELGMVPTFNSIAEIPGTEKPEEYIILSAHFDSWDGGTGATDNGSGSITMMEVARILKEVYPNPKRTILVGLWGSEEQGLNGSRAFVEDNPEIVDGLQALFNQDNGTGRVVSIHGEGFVHSYKYFSRWLNAVPSDVRGHIETSFPGLPSGGGTDHASFVAAGAPAFLMRSLSWDYWNYTWHTNRDTYDKLVFDDLKNNVKLIATLAYMASEDPETFDREKRVMPIDPRTGRKQVWPQVRSPNRSGGN